MTMRRRYRFADFTLSPSRRLLLHRDVEVPLIPRYFDLLLLLIDRRNEAVSREEIFDKVWNDVVVSDGALTQAVRNLRRSLGDDAREPRFIRTVSRHGYRFVYQDVVEEPETVASGGNNLAQAMALLLGARIPETEEEEERLLEAAGTVLRLGTDEELSRLAENDVARAVLRDARWELTDAAKVPVFGKPHSLSAMRVLLGIRARRTLAFVRKRWLGAIVGGAVIGLAGSLAGGLVLLLGPGSTAKAGILVALPLVGTTVGALGAAGVGGGIAWAEALVRSFRRWALPAFGGAGGGIAGAAAHFVGLYTIEGLFGRDLSPIGGGFEGLVIGAAVGAGYALATPLAEGGMATPQGWARLRVALLAGLVTAVSCVGLALTGHYLGAMSLDFTARSFPGSQVSLDPLAHLLGEPHAGALTRVVISAFEGLLFGFGSIFGLTRRIRPDASR